jgi:hypothetical protein
LFATETGTFCTTLGGCTLFATGTTLGHCTVVFHVSD